jgi:hypothetical protein
MSQFTGRGRGMSHVPYASVVGNFMYVMVCTRPNIAHAMGVFSWYLAMGIFSRYLSKLGKEHWIEINLVFRYFHGTTSYGLCYQGKLGLDRVLRIHGCVDTD